jgi:hypothetical protein
MPDRLDRRRAIRFICAAVSAPVIVAIGAQSAAADGAPQPVMQGYGACSACNCPGFTGSYNTCGNCGHNYQTHW